MNNPIFFSLCFSSIPLSIIEEKHIPPICLDIFTQMKPHGTFKAIISTYFISSLLHGVNLQLAAVLLTLGFATYAEHTIRAQLAYKFDACILVKACLCCNHKHSSQQLLVRIVNWIFSMMAIFHLAYLGVLIGEQSTDHYDIHQSILHIRNQWGDLNYLSHWAILLTLTASLIL